ncbi:MAG: [FeFe] hydrogenase H-cluster maturation GTPase HydF [Bacteroidales bacterium]|nr:[FeFe] hydrogenase H-cluster maturation GTPase HydF [Bacteroidales bacterium]
MSKGKDIKPHIGIFGRRNNGKSSLINCLADQDISIVSEIAGTTTDPVKKSIEIFGIGPVILVDTAGVDDSGSIGEQRVKKTFQTIPKIDLAILIITENLLGNFEEELIERFSKFDIPYIIVHNKSDIFPVNEQFRAKMSSLLQQEIIDFSCLNSNDKESLIEKLKKSIPKTAYVLDGLLSGIINKGDTVLLVTPIDSEAPEGRMILPQVQVIRDVLDNDAIVVDLKETQLEEYIKIMSPKPALVITDSQAFHMVDQLVPNEIPLTSFSIVLARQKGNFSHYIKGTPKLGDLNDGDKILLLESCTHQVSCEDIGRFKIPKWLDEFSDKKLEYIMVSGLDDVPGEISDYAIVIQCGGCVITKKQVQNRLKPAIDLGIPVSNYGMAIAYINGIFNRAVLPFTKK